jgi:TonB family protein
MTAPVTETRTSRHGLWALLASAVLHVLVAAWLWAHRDTSPPAEPTRPPVELDVRWVDAHAPEVQPPAAQPRATPAARPTRPEKTATAAPAPSAPSPAPAPTEPSHAGGAPAPGSQLVDAPRAHGLILTPGSGFAARLGTGVSGDGDGDSPRGETLHNDPSELPDAKAVAEYHAEQLNRRIGSDLAQDLAHTRMATGDVAPFFSALQGSMRKKLPKANVERTPLKTDELVRDVAGVVFGGPASHEAQEQMANSGLGQSIARQSVPLGNIEDQRFREGALQLMSQTEAIKERIHAVRLKTVLELTFDPSGALADASITEKSGDAKFDESVLHLSRRFARDLPEMDEKGLGTHWWRTRWQFTWEPPDVRVKLMEAWPLPTPVQ